jgi:Cd2+/Zn2+-exporting ATPase
MAANHISLPDSKAAAGTEILLAIDGIFSGRLLISDTIKADSKSAIAALNKSVQTVMLTGDSQNSAKAIADETGIKEYYAKLLPNDKLELLQKLRKEHGSVMFVGDGINDAPVLAGADCGAAMGSGADAAIEAADVVFMTSELSAIPESIRIAKITNSIAVQNIVFALTIKALFLIMGLLGFASMWMAVFADTGVAVLCILNSIRILRK